MTHYTFTLELGDELNFIIMMKKIKLDSLSRKTSLFLSSNSTLLATITQILHIEGKL